MDSISDHSIFSRSHKTLTLLLYALSAVLFGMHFIRIFDNSFWGDEGFTIRLAKMGFIEMIQATAEDVHPPLYYLFTQLLYHIFGNHGFTYHLSAVLPYGVILVLACTVIRKWFGLIPAAVVVTLSSLTDTAIIYNVEARMYSLGALFLLISYLALYQLLHDGRTRDWIIFSISSLCAAYTHYYALISVAFFYLMLLPLIQKDRSNLKKIVITYGTAIVVYLPWLFVLLASFQRTADNWWSTIIPSLRNCIGFFFNPSWTILIFAVAFILFFWQPAKTSRSNFFTPDVLWIFAGLLSAAGTSAIGLGLSYAIRPFFLLRYLFPLTSVIYLLFGFMLSKIRWRRTLSMVLILGTILWNTPYFYHIYQEEKTVDAATSLCLSVVQPSPNAVIYTSYHHLNWTGADYYFPDIAHFQIDENDLSTVFASDSPEVWLFLQHELSSTELNFISVHNYTCSNVYRGTFADCIADGVSFYVYRLEKITEIVK